MCRRMNGQEVKWIKGDKQPASLLGFWEEDGGRGEERGGGVGGSIRLHDAWACTLVTQPCGAQAGHGCEV